MWKSTSSIRLVKKPDRIEARRQAKCGYIFISILFQNTLDVVNPAVTNFRGQTIKLFRGSPRGLGSLDISIY